MSFRVLGTGMYVPPKVVTNDDLSQFLDTNDAWIQQRVGVRERHISTSETAADMAAKAALAALENSGVAPEEIDLILAATVSGESISPSVSCMVQKLLGLSCMAMDINAACSAFDFLLETAVTCRVFVEESFSYRDAGTGVLQLDKQEIRYVGTVDGESVRLAVRHANLPGLSAEPGEYVELFHEGYDLLRYIPEDKAAVAYMKLAQEYLYRKTL